MKKSPTNTGVKLKQNMANLSIFKEVFLLIEQCYKILSELIITYNQNIRGGIDPTYIVSLKLLSFLITHKLGLQIPSTMDN